jgi:hypothetical protein
LLKVSVAALNSALQRARATLKQHLPLDVWYDGRDAVGTATRLGLSTLVGGHLRLVRAATRLSSGFDVRAISVAPGAERAYDPAEWRDAIVVVEQGEIDLESVSGDSWRFGAGAIVWLAEMPLVALRNRGREAVVLIAVSRRRR